jgi:hypothetical protein
VEPGCQRADVGRDLRRVLDAHDARREEPLGERLGDRFVAILAIGDVRLEHRHRRRAGRARDDLGVAGQGRHRREARLLAEERDELEVGVQAGLDPAVRLEQQLVSEHDARIRLVHAERSLVQALDRHRATWLEVAHRERGATDQGRRNLGDGLRSARQRRDRPSFGDGDGQRPQRAVALQRDPQSAIDADQRDQVGVGRTAVVGDVHERKDVPTVARQHEPFGELDRPDLPPLAAEPAGVGEVGRPEPADRSLDVGPADLHAQTSRPSPSAISHTDHAM